MWSRFLFGADILMFTSGEGNDKMKKMSFYGRKWEEA